MTKWHEVEVEMRFTVLVEVEGIDEETDKDVAQSVAGDACAEDCYTWESRVAHVSRIHNTRPVIEAYDTAIVAGIDEYVREDHIWDDF